MKTTYVFIACLFMVCCNAAKAQTVNLPFTEEKWDMKDADIARENFQGKECMLIKTGAIISKGVDLRDGTIEFDMNFTDGRGFPGIGFRVADINNMEMFYVRPHQSGNPDAAQYTPVFNNQAGWQLYHGEGYSAALPLQPGKWHHVKIDVHGLEAEIYFNDMSKPLIRVTELKRDWKGGSLFLANGGLPTRFANVQYTAKTAATPIAKSIPANGTDGWITRYQVSQQLNRSFFGDKKMISPSMKSAISWSAQSTEPSATLNLSKFTRANDTGNVMIARVVIRSEEDQLKGIAFGFSDYVVVYLNDRVLYTGADNFRSRDYRYLGTIGLFDMLFLPLKKGDNELWFVVSEDFGGWGVKAKLENMEKISLR